MENSMLWAGGNYVELGFSAEDADSILQPGPADETVAYIAGLPYMKAQLDALDPEKIRKELREYGAWDDEELKDDIENRLRLVWTLGCNAAEENLR